MFGSEPDLRSLKFGVFPPLRICQLCMLLLRQPSQTKVTDQNANKLCDMLRRKPDLQTLVKFEG